MTRRNDHPEHARSSALNARGADRRRPAGAPPPRASPAPNRGSDTRADPSGTRAPVPRAGTSAAPCTPGRRGSRAGAHPSGLTSGFGSGAGFRQHASKQFIPVALGELRGDRHVPQPRAGERRAFYGILLRHEHRSRVGELELARGETMVVGKGMLDDLEALRAELAKETRRVADSRDRVHGAATELTERARRPLP